jgi:putative restriction endonuclease
MDRRQQRNFVELTDSLEVKFQEYWSRIFNGRRKSTIALPFYHLQYDGFWYLVSDEVKSEIPVSARKSLRSLAALISGSTLDEELHALFLQPRWAAHLRSVLVTTYFGPELHSIFFES